MVVDPSAEQVARLHAAARRYCMDRIRRTSDVAFADTSTDPVEVFRFHVLEAILAAIESLTPEDLSSVDEAREWLCIEARNADSGSTRHGVKYEREAAAMANERDSFCEFVTSSIGLSEEFEPLPFRRTLSPVEAAQFEARLADRWDPDRYDYPLPWPHLPTPPRDALAFRDEPFYEPEIQDHLRRALESIGVTRVLHVGPELEWKREMDLEYLDAVYDGDDSYWCDSSLNWQIFVSHESIVSIAGERLCDAIRSEWPEGQKWLNPTSDELAWKSSS